MTPDVDPAEALRIENAGLRLRATLAEQQLARLRTAQPPDAALAVVPVGPVRAVRDPIVAQRLASVELENAAFRLRLLGPPAPPVGISVQELVETVALSVAMGEATLADRTIGSLSVSTQFQLVQVAQGAVRVQFPSPATPLPGDALSTMTVELNRTPPAPGQADPPTLYRVLAEKQALYGSGGWFDTDEGKAIVAACTAALGEASGWTFASVLSTADSITTSEQALAAVLTARQPSPAGTPAYASSAAASRQLIDGLKAKTTAVAGDLVATCSALHAATVAASGVAL